MRKLCHMARLCNAELIPDFLNDDDDDGDDGEDVAT